MGRLADKKETGDDTSPGGTSPGGTSPGGTSPGGTSPGDTPPGGTSTGGTPPGGAPPEPPAPVEKEEPAEEEPPEFAFEFGEDPSHLEKLGERLQAARKRRQGKARKPGVFETPEERVLDIAETETERGTEPAELEPAPLEAPVPVDPALLPLEDWGAVGETAEGVGVRKLSEEYLAEQRAKQTPRQERVEDIADVFEEDSQGLFKRLEDEYGKGRVLTTKGRDRDKNPGAAYRHMNAYAYNEDYVGFSVPDTLEVVNPSAYDRGWHQEQVRAATQDGRPLHPGVRLRILAQKGLAFGKGMPYPFSDEGKALFQGTDRAKARYLEGPNSHAYAILHGDHLKNQAKTTLAFGDIAAHVAMDDDRLSDDFKAWYRWATRLPDFEVIELRGKPAVTLIVGSQTKAEASPEFLQLESDYIADFDKKAAERDAAWEALGGSWTTLQHLVDRQLDLTGLDPEDRAAKIQKLGGNAVYEQRKVQIRAALTKAGKLDQTKSGVYVLDANGLKIPAMETLIPEDAPWYKDFVAGTGGLLVGSTLTAFDILTPGLGDFGTGLEAPTGDIYTRLQAGKDMKTYELFGGYQPGLDVDFTVFNESVKALNERKRRYDVEKRRLVSDLEEESLLLGHFGPKEVTDESLAELRTSLESGEPIRRSSTMYEAELALGPKFEEEPTAPAKEGEPSTPAKSVARISTADEVGEFLRVTNLDAETVGVLQEEFLGILGDPNTPVSDIPDLPAVLRRRIDENPNVSDRVKSNITNVVMLQYFTFLSRITDGLSDKVPKDESGEALPEYRFYSVDTFALEVEKQQAEVDRLKKALENVEDVQGYLAATDALPVAEATLKQMQARLYKAQEQRRELVEQGDPLIRVAEPPDEGVSELFAGIQLAGALVGLGAERAKDRDRVASRKELRELRAVRDTELIKLSRAIMNDHSELMKSREVKTSEGRILWNIVKTPYPLGEHKFPVPRRSTVFDREGFTSPVETTDSVMPVGYNIPGASGTREMMRAEAQATRPSRFPGGHEPRSDAEVVEKRQDQLVLLEDRGIGPYWDEGVAKTPENVKYREQQGDYGRKTDSKILAAGHSMGLVWDARIRWKEGEEVRTGMWVEPKVTAVVDAVWEASRSGTFEQTKKEAQEQRQESIDRRALLREAVKQVTRPKERGEEDVTPIGSAESKAERFLERRQMRLDMQRLDKALAELGTEALIQEMYSKGINPVNTLRFTEQDVERYRREKLKQQGLLELYLSHGGR